MNKYIIGAIVLIILVVGGWYLYKDPAEGELSETQLSSYTLGTYPYTCDNGGTFSMSPSSDMSVIRLDISPTESITVARAVSESGVRYEGGEGVIFAARGETVTLTMNATTATCTPFPNTEEPPFNFGD